MKEVEKVEEQEQELETKAFETPEDETGTETGALDWKKAAKKLKKSAEAITDSIDDYFIKQSINRLRARYNAKERSTALFDSIMALAE